MGGGKGHPSHCPDAQEYIVDFDGPDDILNPQNWPTWTKLYIAVAICSGTFVASFNSAIFAAGSNQASREFGVSSEVTTLGTSLFVLGFASGPLVWAPGSELIGRRWPMILGIFGSSIFTIGCAAAKDIQTLIICRFFAGLFGASPLCVVPAVLADIYNSKYRGMAISIYALTVFGGPFLAPFIGAFITTSYLGWRWTLYLPAISGFFNAAILLLFLKESFPPFVLIEKTREWKPIVLLVSLYMSFIYGLVYALLGAYPYVFESVYGMQPGEANLPFLGLFIGVVLAVLSILAQHKSYLRKVQENNGKIVPEWRLPPAMVGGTIFTIGLFWFAWTGFNPDIHWIVPTVAGVFIGFGVLCIFLPCFDYLVDAYLPMAASVVASNIMLRSAVAAGFPLFSKQMFRNLGVQWAGTLLGCLGAVMVPIPVLFWLYGSRLRSKSRMLMHDSSS